MAKKTFTDRYLGSLKATRSGTRFEAHDAIVPGLAVRVTDTGRRSFMLVARYPGAKHPTRGFLGVYVPMNAAEHAVARRQYEALPKDQDGSVMPFDEFLLQEHGATTLAGAREKARRWTAMVARGVDPRTEQRSQRDNQVQMRANSFGSVAEAFIADKLKNERKGKASERELRKDFGSIWARPITKISDVDVLAIVQVKKRTAPHQARNLLTLAKRFFAWAVAQRVYGLKASPCSEIKPVPIFGKKRRRDRVLVDEELFAFWRAVARMPYPYKPVYQLLALTALRLNEAADASWPEFDPAVRRALAHREDDDAPIDWSTFVRTQLAWTIPAERMKGKDDAARPHVVPLTPDVLAILEALPRWRAKFLFSANGGESPVWVSRRACS